MATRFYLPSTGNAPIEPTASAGWEDTTINDFLSAVTTKISSAMTTVSFTDANAANRDILFRTYVTDPLAAQTISAQALEFQIRAKERATTCNLFTVLNVKLVSNDGSIVRGTLLSMQRDATELDEAALENRRLTATTTEVTCHLGDRLVFEIGTAGDPASGSDHDSDISVGDDSGTDLPEDDTDQNAYNPWIEFPNTLTFWTTGDLIVYTVGNDDTNVASSSSRNITIPASISNQYVVVGVLTYDGTSDTDQEVTGVTCGGTPMAKLEDLYGEPGSGEWVSFWGLETSASGTVAIAVTLNGSAENHTTGWLVFGNAAQTGQPDANNESYDTVTANPTVGLTTLTDRSVVVSISASSDFGTQVPTSPQVPFLTGFTGFNRGSYTNPTTPTGAVEHLYTNGNTDDWTQIIVAIKKFSAVAAIPNKIYAHNQSVKRSSFF